MCVCLCLRELPFSRLHAWLGLGLDLWKIIEFILFANSAQICDWYSLAVSCNILSKCMCKTAYWSLLDSLCVADCQYTCHLQCVPSVTLDCTTVSPGSGQGPVATPTDLPSPSASAETSLTERRTIVTRSPQKQQQQQPQPASAAYSELSAQAAPQSVQHLGPPGGACGSSSPSQNVLLPSTSARDPLLGACESQAVAQSSSNVLSSAAPSLSLCAERDLNQNAKNVDGDSLVPGRVGEDVCDASNVSWRRVFVSKCFAMYNVNNQLDPLKNWKINPWHKFYMKSF